MNLMSRGKVVLVRKGIARSHSSVALATTIAALLLPSIVFAFNLVSPEEVAASAQYESQNPASLVAHRTRAFDPRSPRIEIISPDLGGSTILQSPLKIQVKFESMDKVEVIPDSFRAQYGAFRIDITDRLLKAANVTKDGILVDKAELPAGSHRLFLKVQDSSNRIGEREVRFTVQ